MLPVAADVIERVHMLAARSTAGQTFTDVHGAIYDDDNKDFSPEEDGNIVNEDNADNTSEELVTIDEDE